MSSDRRAFLKAALGAAVAAGCGRRPGPEAGVSASAALLGQPWAEIDRAARGQTVTWMKWRGDPYINAYVDGWVAPRLLERHGVSLKTVAGQGNEIVSLMMTEREARRETSAVDLVWINGETFFQLRQVKALLGPFTGALPNAALVDWKSRFVGTDFQQPVDGWECPWGTVQLALITDEVRVPDPPRTAEALETWAKAHPGRFTFDASFTGMTFLKSLLYAFGGGEKALAGPFDERRYAEEAPKLWTYLKRLKPHLWKKGETFPVHVAPLHQLFAAGEVDFTMSNNDGEVDNKIQQGLFPRTAFAYVLATGTIRNSHFVGIPARARNVAGALVTANFLVSPEAQAKKLEPATWADGTVLDVARLPEPWRARFETIPGRVRAPRRETLEALALMEPAPEYMLRLQADFRREIVGST